MKHYLLPMAGNDLMKYIAFSRFSLVTFCSSFFHSYTLLLYMRMLNLSVGCIFSNIMERASLTFVCQFIPIELLISIVNTKSLGRDGFMSCLKKCRPRPWCHYEDIKERKTITYEKVMMKFKHSSYLYWKCN